MTPHKDFFLHPRPSTPPPPPPPARPGPLQVFNPHAAGIDIGEAEHWVAVPPDRAPQPIRRFGTCTADLDVLATVLGRLAGNVAGEHGPAGPWPS